MNGSPFLRNFAGTAIPCFKHGKLIGGVDLVINSSRLAQHFEILSQFGRIADTGVCRPALSKIEKEAFSVVSNWMREAGMSVRLDNFGNLIGCLEGKNKNNPVLMIGSHLDSQPYGGRFDGVSGVLAGIEAVASIVEQGIIPESPIEVVSFCDEESWRFRKGLFGSRGILGMLEPGELNLTDNDGVTREQALREFGCNPDKMEESIYPRGRLGAYLELHIEQGPVLEHLDLPLGIVTGIAGPLRLTVTMKGFAGHSGTVPMKKRRDALVGASEVVLEINRIVQQENDAPTVGTVGSIRAFPDAPNIIPEEVEFTIDLRDIDKNRRDRYEKEIREAISKAAAKNDLTYTIREDNNNEPRLCAEWIRQTIREESLNMGLQCPELISGAYHDALVLSYACDIGMIFVRCRDGISHNPAEFASYDDLALGTELLYRTTLSTSEKIKLL